MELDSSVVYTEEELSPLFQMIGKLHCLMDDHIHLQQAAGTTKVGYNTYYDHKLDSIQGLTNYCASRVDKEYWVHDQTDTEKEILKAKAHKQFLSSVSRRNQSGGGSRPAGGDGTSQSGSAQSKHNKEH